MDGHFRSFDAAIAEYDQAPIAFEVAGEHFECIPVLPARTYLRVFNGEHVGTLDFFRSVLSEDDIARFEELLDRKEQPVSIGQVNDIGMWLIEVYAGRPTERPSSSPAGPSPTGQSSKVVSLSARTVTLDEAVS